MTGASVASSFPDPVSLSRAIETIEVDANLTIADLLPGLRADREQFRAYATVEDLAIAEDTDAEAATLLGRMMPLRNAIAQELWSRELFVALEIVDHLVFQALAGNQDESPVRQVLRRLKDGRVDAAGFVVFAVHSLGLTTEDLRGVLQPVELIDGEWGIAITSQTNALGRTIEFLDRVRSEFGVAGSTPNALIGHWHRSRQASWLERNPLLCVRVAEAAGSYYGNEALLLVRLQTATAFIAMLAAAQPPPASSGRAHISTWS